VRRHRRAGRCRSTEGPAITIQAMIEPATTGPGLQLPAPGRGRSSLSDFRRGTPVVVYVDQRRIRKDATTQGRACAITVWTTPAAGVRRPPSAGDLARHHPAPPPTPTHPPPPPSARRQEVPTTSPSLNFRCWPDAAMRCERIRSVRVGEVDVRRNHAGNERSPHVADRRRPRKVAAVTGWGSTSEAGPARQQARRGGRLERARQPPVV